MCEQYQRDRELSALAGTSRAANRPSARRNALSRGTADDRAVLRVRDRGAGIAEDEIARLFQPFHRAASSRDDVPGTGIDLYVVRRIVEAHGGRIAVHSPIGAGSEFVVRLPLEATAPRDVLDTAIDGPSGPGAG